MKRCHMFFFSSRRRHTRFTSGWSSDVCSSDLGGTLAKELEVQDDKIDVDQIVPVFGTIRCLVIDIQIPRRGRKTWMC